MKCTNLADCVDQHQCNEKALNSVGKAEICLRENLQNRFEDMNSTVLHATKLEDLKSMVKHCEGKYFVIISFNIKIIFTFGYLCSITTYL